METDTNRVAAEQTNAAFRESVERRAAMQAAAAEQPSAAICRICEEPTSLLELRDLDGLCADCESEQSERLRQDAWDSHFESIAEEIEMDRQEFGR